MSTIDLTMSSDTDPDEVDTDLEGFVVYGDEVETVQTTEDQDENEILQQYDQVNDLGTQVRGGLRRSTRVSKPTDRYRDPEFDKIYFTSGDEADWESEEEEDEEDDEWVPDDNQ